MLTQNFCRLRNIDLFSFLLKYDPTGWHRISLRQIKGVVHDSCIVTYNKGWSWFSKGLFSKNAIDFLIRYYELDFETAIQILSNYSNYEFLDERHDMLVNKGIHQEKSLPKIALKPWKELYSYLCYKRLINKNIVDTIIEKQIIYQTTGKYPNICFVNYENNHWEMVGTSSVRFKRISDGSSYWVLPFSFNKVFVTESAIDAISLYELLQDESASYISIGGSMSRVKLLKKIVEQFRRVILAVDRDEAGNKIAKEFPCLERVLPKHKDFNEDLIVSKLKREKLDLKLGELAQNERQK